MVLVENNQIIASGSAIVTALKDGDQVEIKGDRITRVKKADDLAQAAADKFKADYKATLELVVATVKVENETAVKAAQAAFDKLSDAAKLKLATEKQLLKDLQDKINELKGESADQDMVNAELAKVVNVELAAGTDLTQNQETLVKKAVESKVDLNKVTVTVVKGANDNTYNVKLDSKAAAGTANKNITVTAAKTEAQLDQEMVDAELAKVVNVELVAGTDLTQNQEALVKTAVEAKVNLNKVTITVTKGTDDNTYNVKLDSRAAAGTANKDITVTVAP